MVGQHGRGVSFGLKRVDKTTNRDRNNYVVQCIQKTKDLAGIQKERHLNNTFGT